MVQALLATRAQTRAGARSKKEPSQQPQKDQAAARLAELALLRETVAQQRTEIAALKQSLQDQSGDRGGPNALSWADIKAPSFTTPPVVEPMPGLGRSDSDPEPLGHFPASYHSAKRCQTAAAPLGRATHTGIGDATPLGSSMREWWGGTPLGCIENGEEAKHTDMSSPPSPSIRQLPALSACQTSPAGSPATANGFSSPTAPSAPFQLPLRSRLLGLLSQMKDEVGSYSSMREQMSQSNHIGRQKLAVLGARACSSVA
ncbi:unnamed protein product [Chrysoparadoxa australica]